MVARHDRPPEERLQRIETYGARGSARDAVGGMASSALRGEDLRFAVPHSVASLVIRFGLTIVNYKSYPMSTHNLRNPSLRADGTRDAFEAKPRIVLVEAKPRIVWVGTKPRIVLVEVKPRNVWCVVLSLF